MRLAQRPRRGFTLLEVLGLMFAMTLALILGTSLLLVAVRANAAASKTLLRLNAQKALADRFRADVAAARSVLFPPEREREADVSGEIILTRSEDERITYRHDNGIVVRIQRVKDKVTRDEFALGAECRGASFARSDRMLTLRLHGRGDARQDISAAVGGDQR